MGDVDPELRRYRVDIHSIAMGFPEPGSAYKIRVTDDFGDEVPFRKFGYMNFDGFLNDHPSLERVFLDGKTCYRAKVSEKSAEIQSLVARQKKKKRKGGKKPMAPFQRNGQNRSFQVRPPFSYNNFNQRSFRGGRGGATPQPGFARASFSTLPRQQQPQSQQYGGFGASTNGFTTSNAGFGGSSSGGFGSSSGGFGTNSGVYGANRTGIAKSSTSFGTSTNGFGMGRPSAPPVQPTPTPVVDREPVKSLDNGPAAGKARIIAALKKCQGKATLTKLNYCYQTLYNTQLDSNEMQNFFSTNNFRAIYRDWLSDEMDLNPDPSGQWVFLSKEIARQQQEWAATHKNITVDENPRPKWDKPSLKELYDKVVAMLVNMYPEPLQVTQMSEIYKRAHGVLVDPNDLYCKTWEDLVRNIFRDKMTLKPNGRIVLSDKAVRDHGLSTTVARTAVHTAIKRVTAGDLGLEYSDDSDSDGDEEEGNSIGSSSTGGKPSLKASSSLRSTPASPSCPPSVASPSGRSSIFSRLTRTDPKTPLPAPTTPPLSFMELAQRNSFTSVMQMGDTLKSYLQEQEAAAAKINGKGFSFGSNGFGKGFSRF